MSDSDCAAGDLIIAFQIYDKPPPAMGFRTS